jgi:large subunit ribosomal protein L9
MLLPRGLATEATDRKREKPEKQKGDSEANRQKELAEAKELAAKLAQLTVKIVTKSGEGGRLFGSITSKDVADALADQHKISIDKRKFILKIPSSIRGIMRSISDINTDLLQN